MQEILESVKSQHAEAPVNRGCKTFSGTSKQASAALLILFNDAEEIEATEAPEVTPKQQPKWLFFLRGHSLPGRMPEKTFELPMR